MPKIVTENVYPPIPIRQFDWVAHYDDPEGPTGWGRTEQEAIADLTENHPRESPASSLNKVHGLMDYETWCEMIVTNAWEKWTKKNGLGLDGDGRRETEKQSSTPQTTSTKTT